MNKLINSIKSSSLVKFIDGGATKFIREEEGAQIVEYALIIAVVSIGMVVALSALLGDGAASTPFGTFIGRVKTCLIGTGTCA